MKDPTESRFLLAWLYSAALVTALRFLSAAAPGYDLGWQIQAAQNLLAGHGLSLYQHTRPNLTDPASLIRLTQFPSGYSLLAAALMTAGLGVGGLVKVLGAAGTMLGWWGWGKLAQSFFGEGLKRSTGWRRAGFAIAIVTPLLFTQPWGGTDIFLWAAAPWVLDWLVRASDDNVPGGLWFDGLAGALCGLSLLMRYASLVLAAYAACVILWQSRLRMVTLTRRWGAFGLGLLPALTLQGYVNYFMSNSPVRLGGVSPGGLFSLNVDFGGHLRRLWDGVPLLYMVNYAWAFWVPGKLMNLLVPEVTGAWPWQLGITLIGFAVLLLAVKSYGIDLTSASRDPRVVASGLFLAVPVTLLGCMMLSSWAYVADLRLYAPVVPLGVFVAYSIGSLPSIRSQSRLRVLQSLSALYLTGYIAMALVYITFLFVPGQIGTSQRDKLLATDLHHWPSMAVTYESSLARRFVMQLLKEQPDTLLLTSKGGWFYWDPAVNRSRIYELSCEELRATYLSGPARIVIFTFDQGPSQELWYYKGDGIHGGIVRADCFERLSNYNVLQRFPQEGVKVLGARVEAGRQIVLKP